MRDGVPLPGKSPTEVLSLLAHRVFCPLRADRTQVVLDFHGLAGRNAGPVKAVAARFRVTTRTLSARAAKVRAAGTRLPLPTAIVREAMRDSRPGEDHLGRVRVATTLGLPSPVAPPPPPVVRPGPTVPPSDVAAARAGLRVLAAVGPSPLKTVTAAVARSRQFRRAALSEEDLAAALTVLGAVTDADGRWRAPPAFPVPDRYRSVVATAAGRELTRSEMISVLMGAGYSPSSAGRLLSTTYPLFERLGPNRYRLIGPAVTEG